MTDATGGVEFLNAAYCDFFGVTVEDVRGPKWATLLRPDDADPYVGAYYEALRQRKPFRAEARVRGETVSGVGWIHAGFPASLKVENFSDT